MSDGGPKAVGGGRWAVGKLSRPGRKPRPARLNSPQAYYGADQEHRRFSEAAPLSSLQVWG